MPDDPLVDTWAINARINLYLLDALKPGDLRCQAPTGGRTVGETFAHIHNVRLMWLKAGQPALLHGLQKLEKSTAVELHLLKTALSASAEAVAALVASAQAAGGRLKGFRPHAHAFVGYLIAHEAHHRGQVMLALKHGGVRVEKSIAYGLWEWGVR